MSRYTLTSEFRTGTAELYWAIFDNETKRKVVECYSFDGTSSFLCDALNWNHQQTAETGIGSTILLTNPELPAYCL